MDGVELLRAVRSGVYEDRVRSSGMVLQEGRAVVDAAVHDDPSALSRAVLRYLRQRVAGLRRIEFEGNVLH